MKTRCPAGGALLATASAATGTTTGVDEALDDLDFVAAVASIGRRCRPVVDRRKVTARDQLVYWVLDIANGATRRRVVSAAEVLLSAGVADGQHFWVWAVVFGLCVTLDATSNHSLLRFFRYFAYAEHVDGVG